MGRRSSPVHSATPSGPRCWRRCTCQRFADAAPATVYATLLDEGTYVCSEPTMYQLLRERNEVRERRSRPPIRRP
ncbi:hypothetical protein LAUMK191_02565 [Mycobacterium attenuatum]|uniref:Uncharacterized protein n=1 Tax=Mycobacterium attenuatum TaxID=2341086 RepID=A0A498Q489_9MYCO|nr:hypothetical protein LAUMK136_02563 [Mycobacterium attenuatum]VBA52779.1 hypothetical protein LAUMK191_02565 [Mycobacterium attenuatum]